MVYNHVDHIQSRFKGQEAIFIQFIVRYFFYFKPFPLVWVKFDDEKLRPYHTASLEKCC